MAKTPTAAQGAARIPEERVMLTVAEFARATGMAEKTVREWCRNGEVHAVKLGGTWLINRKDAFDER